jgi:hypothetical protein
VSGGDITNEQQAIDHVLSRKIAGRHGVTRTQTALAIADAPGENAVPATPVAPVAH